VSHYFTTLTIRVKGDPVVKCSFTQDFTSCCYVKTVPNP